MKRGKKDCSVQAIVAAFGLNERTGPDWHRRAGARRGQAHQHLAQPARDLGQVRADEIRPKHQRVYREVVTHFSAHPKQGRYKCFGPSPNGKSMTT